VEMPDRRVSGRVEGIDTDGTLILMGEGGGSREDRCRGCDPD